MRAVFCPTLHSLCLVGSGFWSAGASYPWRLDYRVSCASGYVYCSCSGSTGLECRKTPPLLCRTLQSWIFCRIAIISVLIATCSGISALPTRVDRPSEFHGHRALFSDLAPARRGAIGVFHVACSAGPCGSAPPAATARDFNTEFSPATFSGQPRSCRLVGQSEFQFWSD